MRVALTLALLIFGTSASAQVDPLAPLPVKPAPSVQPAQYSPPPLASPSLTGFAA